MCSQHLDPWSLPEALQVGDHAVPIRADFRDVLKVMAAFNEELPCYLKWCKALRLFYKEPILPQHRREAAEAMVSFLGSGEPGRPLISWSHDAPLIAAEVNKVAGFEVRQQKFVHWWTFLGWFHSIGDGPFAQVVAIRQKLHSGKKLTDREKQFYIANKSLVRLPDPPQVQREKAYLESLLK